MRRLRNETTTSYTLFDHLNNIWWKIQIIPLLHGVCIWKIGQHGIRSQHTYLERSSRDLHGPGPGSTDNVQVRAEFKWQQSSLIYNTSGSLEPFVFRKEKVIRSCAHLMLVTQSGFGNKSHRLDFLGDFRSCPLPEIVRDKTLQTWHPVSLYRSSNAKIASDVLWASLNNSFKDYWHYALKTRINEERVRAYCEYAGLHSGWNKRKSGLGGVRVTDLKINFGFGLGRVKWSSGRAGCNSKISVRADLYEVQPGQHSVYIFCKYSHPSS
jgi:hypothetical protein